MSTTASPKVARALTLRRGGELVATIQPAEGKRIKGVGVTPTLGAFGIALSVAQRWVSLVPPAPRDGGTTEGT